MKPPPVWRFHSAQSRSNSLPPNITVMKIWEMHFGGNTTSFYFKLNFSVPFFERKTLMVISYSKGKHQGWYFSCCRHSLSLTKFSFPLNAPLSKTWHYGKCILLGLCWKENPGISHSGPFSAVTGGTFWLQVIERIPTDLPQFVLLWCLFPECQMWSLFKQCPTFIHLALISATTEVVVPNCGVWNVVCCVKEL